MKSLHGFAALFAAGVIAGGLAWRVGPAGAVHDPDLTDDEVKCQIAASAVDGQFVVADGACLLKCAVGTRKGKNPAADCLPPFAGKTKDCVTKARLKGAGLMAKKCAKDCPECYRGPCTTNNDCAPSETCTGGFCAADCTSVAPLFIANVEAAVDAAGALVACNDGSAAGALTDVEFKCEQTVGKVLTNFANKKLACLAKCRRDEHKGKTPKGSCDTPITTNPSAQQKAKDCVRKEETKAVGLIDKKCGDKPECFGALDGAGWVNLVEANVDGGTLYCGSPSAAFVDGGRLP